MLNWYSADGKYEVSYKPNVVIYSHGEVLWIPPAIYKSSCTIDVQYFPFDQQECQMKFGSWTFNGDQVSLSTLSISIHRQRTLTKPSTKTFIQTGGDDLVDLDSPGWLPYTEICVALILACTTFPNLLPIV